MRRWQSIGDYTRKTTQLFSVSILIRTLFEPWRRIISYPGAGLSNHFRAMIDNLFSRLVGFCVRMLVMALTAIILIFIVLIGLTLVIIWPFLPFIMLGLIIKGVF